MQPQIKVIPSYFGALGGKSNWHALKLMIWTWSTATAIFLHSSSSFIFYFLVNCGTYVKYPLFSLCRPEWHQNLPVELTNSPSFLAGFSLSQNSSQGCQGQAMEERVIWEQGTGYHCFSLPWKSSDYNLELVYLFFYLFVYTASDRLQQLCPL